MSLKEKAKTAWQIAQALNVPNQTIVAPLSKWVRLVDAQPQLNHANREIEDLKKSRNNWMWAACETNSEVEELKGRLQRIRECWTGLEDLKAHWDIDREAGYPVNEELYAIVVKLLAVVQGDGAAETEKILEAWTKGSKASPYVPLGEGEGDNP